MRVLIVKTSSLGDIVHALPAVHDARRAHPEVKFDWVLEKSFQAAALWHPAVEKVIACQLRTWRKHPWQAIKTREWQVFITQLRRTSYDLVIDAQGLIKSAILTRLAHGKSVGYDEDSARESVATRLYDRRCAVSREQHAIARLRSLFAQALDYPLPEGPIEYGLDSGRFEHVPVPRKTLIFVHATTWATKHWPNHCWLQLIKLAEQAGYRIWLPWGNAAEKKRATMLAAASDAARVLPRLNLNQIASLLSQATGVVAVDSGLSHITAAVGTPAVTLYGSTDPALTGTRGEHQHHLAVEYPCAPCFKRKCQFTEGISEWPPCYNTVKPERVWETLESTITERDKNPCLITEPLD